jgi:DNA/RNA-binding domain of Phe-tRNA-synthetase-like protein
MTSAYAGAHSGILGLQNMSSSQITVEVSDTWRQTFPTARVGLVALENVSNPVSHEVLQLRVAEIEAALRAQYARADRPTLSALPAIAAYQRHYRAFGQTYHVLRQLESVALNGKTLASPSALVVAMFAAELESLLLTAGHDLDAVCPPLVLDRSDGGDTFTGIGGQVQTLRSGDMLMRDAQGIISSVIYGPDRRTRMTPSTTRVLFTTYAPEGIGSDTLRSHLEELATLTRIVAPAASIQLMGVFP